MKPHLENISHRKASRRINKISHNLVMQAVVCFPSDIVYDGIPDKDVPEPVRVFTKWAQLVHRRRTLIARRSAFRVYCHDSLLLPRHI